MVVFGVAVVVDKFFDNFGLEIVIDLFYFACYDADCFDYGWNQSVFAGFVDFVLMIIHFVHFVDSNSV